MSTPSLHRALYAYLSTYAPLQRLIGMRCYPSVAPQEGTFPYLTVQRLGVVSPYAMSGPSATHETKVQVDCWALSALEAQQVAAVVRQAVDGFPADLDEPALDGLEVDGVFVEHEVDDAEFAKDGSERTFYRTILTLEIWHEFDLPAR